MSQRSEVSWAALILIFVGLFGVAVAVTALWSELPAPAAGGTCGPGRGSETAIEALVNPGSIGAGAEPPTSRAAARIQWNQFVDQCQSATDDRALLAFPVLVVSAGIAVMGFVLLRRRGGRSADGASPAQPEATWSPPPDTLFAMSSPLVSPPPATVAGGAYRTFDAPPPPPSGAPSPPPPPPPPPLPPVSPPPPPAAHGPLPWGPPGHPGDPPA